MTYPELMSIKGIGKKRYETITAIMQEQDWSLDDVYMMSAEALKANFGLPKNVAEAVAIVRNPQSAKAAMSQPDQSTAKQKNETVALSTTTVLKIDVNSKDYPQALKHLLGQKSPATLYAWGELRLTQQTRDWLLWVTECQ